MGRYLELVGIGQGKRSPLLEAHEAVGTTIMALAIAHAGGMIMFASMTRYGLVGVTFIGGLRSFLEGGARGAPGFAIGAMLGIAALAYVWGPFDIAAKAAVVGEGETGGKDRRNVGQYDDK
jgi:hypothetical protein